MFKLYQTAVSPFPARVRLALYAKGLPFETLEPPGFGGSTAPKGAFLKLNPMGRVPVLILEDGRALPESEVICEYLEDVHPTPALRPSDPWDRAKVRLLTRISDIYLIMAMVPLFDLLEEAPAAWDRNVINAAVSSTAKALGFLDFYIGAHGYAVGQSLSLADGALAPMIILADEWIPTTFGCASPLTNVPALQRYWQAVQTDPIVGRISTETRSALAASRKRRA